MVPTDAARTSRDCTSSGVPSPIPDMESATRVPTSGRRDGNVVEKLQGLSGLNEADRHTAVATRQNAEDVTIEATTWRPRKVEP